MPDVRIYATDDQDMHRSMLKLTVGGLNGMPGVRYVVEREFPNGKELIDALASGTRPPDLFTLDIRMPTQDGLTTLMLIRRKLNLRQPVLMVSSEEEANITRRAGAVDPKIAAMTNADKLAQLAKVEARILSGVVEPGKINDLLSGCERLQMDPRAYAQSLGANGFLHKPFTADQAARVVPEAVNGKSFACN